MKLIGQIFHFMSFSEKQFLFGWACHILGKEMSRKFGLKQINSTYFWAFEGNSSKMSLKSLEPLNYIFLVQNSFSVTKFLGKKLKIMDLETIFQLFHNFASLLPQYFWDNWILFFTCFLLIKPQLAKIWLVFI